MSRFTYRPISTWPNGAMTPSAQRVKGQFRASDDQTDRLLKFELEKLGARDVTIEVGVTELDLRVDGRLRAAAVMQHPGVVVSFDSEWGYLRYAADRFTDWRQNLRAIALGLEHLRTIDRYGISNRGEQYTGWKQLGSGASSEVVKPLSKDDAREALYGIIELYGVEFRPEQEVTDAQIIRRAQRATHPDTRARDVPDEAWVATERATALLSA